VLAADTFAARLRGLEEVPSISSAGAGFLLATLNDAETALSFTIVYFGLSSTVTQSHIHVGQLSVNGGITLFFCTNLTPPAGVPAPQACTNNPGINSISGTLTAADVLAVGAQGVAAGAFADVIRAMKAGDTYANVHTSNFPGGEIRGQVTR
jgi:hypothetical protein